MKKDKKYFENRMDVEIIPIYIEVPAGERMRRAVEREEKQKNPNYKEGIYRVANMSLKTKKYPQALEYYSNSDLQQFKRR